MKKTYLTILAIAMVLVAVAAYFAKHAELGFDVSEYQSYIDRARLSGDYCMIKVWDASTEDRAMVAAEFLLREKYDELTNVQVRRNIDVQYDQSAGVWLISSVTEQEVGYFVLIERSTRNVLAIWCDDPGYYDTWCDDTGCDDDT